MLISQSKTQYDVKWCWEFVPLFGTSTGAIISVNRYSINQLLSHGSVLSDRSFSAYSNEFCWVYTAAKHSTVFSCINSYCIQISNKWTRTQSNKTEKYGRINKLSINWHARSLSLSNSSLFEEKLWTNTFQRWKIHSIFQSA